MGFLVDPVDKCYLYQYGINIFKTTLLTLVGLLDIFLIRSFLIYIYEHNTDTILKYLYWNKFHIKLNIFLLFLNLYLLLMYSYLKVL